MTSPDATPTWLFFSKHKRMEGTLPENLGKMPSLSALELNSNMFSGTLPRSLHELPTSFSSLMIDNNRFTGSLDVLGGARLIQAAVHDNPGLCGMVRTTMPWYRSIACYCC